MLDNFREQRTQDKKEKNVSDEYDSYILFFSETPKFSHLIADSYTRLSY